MPAVPALPVHSGAAPREAPSLTREGPTPRSSVHPPPTRSGPGKPGEAGHEVSRPRKVGRHVHAARTLDRASSAASPAVASPAGRTDPRFRAGRSPGLPRGRRLPAVLSAGAAQSPETRAFILVFSPRSQLDRPQRVVHRWQDFGLRISGLRGGWGAVDPGVHGSFPNLGSLATRRLPA